MRDLLAQPAAWPLAALLSFLSGPWSEEFGWRGFALDPLLQRLGRLPGAIVLGLIWGIWHLPLYFVPATWYGQMGFKPAGFLTFLLLSVGLSLIITWVYLHTHRAILAAMLLHFTSNFTAQLIAPSSDRVEVFRALIVLAVGLSACLLLERQARQHRQPAVNFR